MIIGILIQVIKLKTNCRVEHGKTFLSAISSIFCLTNPTVFNSFEVKLDKTFIWGSVYFCGGHGHSSPCSVMAFFNSVAFTILIVIWLMEA